MKNLILAFLIIFALAFPNNEKHFKRTERSLQDSASRAASPSFAVDISSDEKFIYDKNDVIKIKVTLSNPATALLTVLVDSPSGLFHQSGESMDIPSGEKEKEFTLTTDSTDKNSKAQYVDTIKIKLVGAGEYAGKYRNIEIMVYNPDKASLIINPYVCGKEGEEHEVEFYLALPPTRDVKLYPVIQNTSLSNTLIINYEDNTFKQEGKYYKLEMKFKMEDDKKFTESLHIFNITFCLETYDLNYLVIDLPNMYYVIEEITPIPSTVKSPIIQLVTPNPSVLYNDETIEIVMYFNIGTHSELMWYYDGASVTSSEAIDILYAIVPNKYLLTSARITPIKTITKNEVTTIKTALVEGIYLDYFKITLTPGEREKQECNRGYDELKEVINIKNEFEEIVKNGNTQKIVDAMTSGITVLGDKCANVKCVYGKCNKDNGECICDEGYEGDYCDKPNAIDGGWSEWSDYGECNVSCGKGTKTRTRKCNNPTPRYGGKDCVGTSTETIECEKEKCTSEIDGGWSEWSKYSECSAKYENGKYGLVKGTKLRRRKCNNPLPSESGKKCVGESKETVECSISCKRNEMLCPGTVRDIEGNIIGKPCNDNGICKYNDNNTMCYEGEPNCYRYCECDKDYHGVECNMNEITFNQRKELRSKFLQTMADTITSKTTGSSGSVDDLASSSKLLKDLSSSTSEIDANSILNIKKSIDNTLEGLKRIRRSRRLRSTAGISTNTDSKMNLLFTTSNIISTKRYLETVNENERVLSDEKVSNDDLDKTIHNIIEDENEIEFNGDNFGVKVVNDISKEIKDNNGGKIDINEETFKEIKELGPVQGIEMINYNENLFKDNNTKESSLLSISIRYDGNKNVKVTELNNPIIFSQRLSGNVNLKEVQCSYYDEEKKEYSTNGTYVFEIYEDDNGDVILTCGTIHLSKFSGFISKSIPKMNVVNPISDAKLLFKYNNSNITIPLVFSGIILLFFVCWVVIYYLSKKQREMLEEERFNLYLKRGKIEEDSMKIYTDESMSFCKRYFEIFKREYHYANVFIAPISAYTIVSRSERMLILLSTILTNFAVLALFYGSNSENLNQMLGNGIISCLCMLPVTIILPRLFYYANNFTLKGLRKKNKKKVLNPTICKLLCNCFNSNGNKKETEFSSIPISDNVTTTNTNTNNKENIKRRREILNIDNWYIIISTISVIMSIILLILALCVTKFNLLGIVIGVIMIVMMLCNFHGVYAILKMNKQSIIGNLIEHFVIIVLLAISLGISIPLASHNTNNSFVYKLWQFGVNSNIFKEITNNIESELNCCGFYDINDYNSHSYCVDNEYIMSNDVVSCNKLIYDKMTTYAMIMIFSSFIYLMISIVLVISDLMMFKYNKNKIYSIENSVYDDENDVYDVENVDRYKNVEDLKKLIKIQMNCKKYLLNSRVKRRNEYKLWYEQKRIRNILSGCAFGICFVYLVIVIYIDLLYGVKFSSSQSKHWIISCLISFVIDMIIQEPTVILAKSVAGNVGLLLLKAFL